MKVIEIGNKNVTPDWSEKSVNDVKNKLKKKKSCDPYGISNEFIQGGGRDVLSAVTKLINGIKSQQCLQTCNITSIHKNKGSKKISTNTEEFLE